MTWRPIGDLIECGRASGEALDQMIELGRDFDSDSDSLVSVLSAVWTGNPASRRGVAIVNVLFFTEKRSAGIWVRTWTQPPAIKVYGATMSFARWAPKGSKET